MTPWAWWAKAPDDDAYGLACEEPTREACIASVVASGDIAEGERFFIIEARSSTAQRHAGDDFIPFVRVRFGEELEVRAGAAVSITGPATA